MRRFFLVVTVFCLMLSTFSCFDGPWTDTLENVPYCPQERYNYCAIACIQMWAWYQGYTNVTQPQIANYIGVTTFGAYPDMIVQGIERFTASLGFLVEYKNTNLGQDCCIAACIAAIKDFTPSIMPFYGGTHGVLVIGYTWHYENKIRIADDMEYHDPNPEMGPNKNLTPIGLKTGAFWTVKNKYMAIVGRRLQLRNGLDGYNTFIAEGGTFYGGPSNYNPLTFNFSQN